MITLSKSYTINGQTFATLELAQKHALATLIQETIGANDVLKPITAAEIIVSKHQQVVDWLTMKPNSRPRARTINGARRTRKPKDVLPAKAPETAKCGQLDHLV